ncbi:MAG: hypothetical protein M1326_10135 [Cyanobacteria bacterium]|nr:hypothetical protein [Cyanobacteriota bacterium]
MPLTIYQKSVYLTIFNATMISRSVGRTFHGNQLRFKKKVFNIIECLTSLMDAGDLTEEHIINAIYTLSNDTDVSWGQAQKPINVILKYHFFLTIGLTDPNNEIKRVLHCPIDSKILNIIGRPNLKLTNIDETTYMEIQMCIQEQGNMPTRVDFDEQWDKQHLQDAGIE